MTTENSRADALTDDQATLCSIIAEGRRAKPKHLGGYGENMVYLTPRMYKALDRFAASPGEQPAAAPIDMILYCPNCGTQHIDRPELHSEADASIGLQIKEVVTWDNPPHRSHLCSTCRHVWRPADAPTNGVAAIKTRGKDDKLPNPQCAPSAIVQPAPSPADERAAFDAWFADAWTKYEDKEVTSEIKSKVWALKAWRHLFFRAASASETGAEGAFIDIVFDGPPSRESGRFVEVEDEHGRSFNAGEWIDRANGLWALRIARAPAQADARVGLTDELRAEIGRLNTIINTPQADDFLRAVSIEAEHQRQRWGSEHDAGKSPADWFWLVGYLAGKALHAAAECDAEKAEHHVITTAAACANWHKAIRALLAAYDRA